MLADSPRTATVLATSDCRLWVLPGRAFLSVLTGFAATSRVITAASATTARYDAATVVFGENDPGSDVYFIDDGQVEFDRAGERIRALGQGLLFGERAALRNGVTRAATATAVPGTVLWRIPGEQVRAAVTRR